MLVEVAAYAGRFVVIAAAMTLAETTVPRRIGVRRAPLRSRRCDARWMGLHLVLAPAGAFNIALTAAVADHQRLPLHRLPLPGRVVVALLAYDLAAYWTHRGMHAHRLLRRWHGVHHSSSELRWWTTYRFHPISALLSQIPPLAAMAALGPGSAAVEIVVTIVIVVTLLAHADVWLPDRALSWLVVTPTFHRRHHHPATAETNFALVLPVFDRLFATTSPGQPSTQAPTATDATLATALNRSVAQRSQPVA